MLLPETEFILRFNTVSVLVNVMRKRLSRQDFLECLEAIWEEGPPVKYQNPDAWIQALPLCVI
jgi:hypothetical protein